MKNKLIFISSLALMGVVAVTSVTAAFMVDGGMPNFGYLSYKKGKDPKNYYGQYYGYAENVFYDVKVDKDNVRFNVHDGVHAHDFVYNVNYSFANKKYNSSNGLLNLDAILLDFSKEETTIYNFAFERVKEFPLYIASSSSLSTKFKMPYLNVKSNRCMDLTNKEQKIEDLMSTKLDFCSEYYSSSQYDRVLKIEEDNKTAILKKIYNDIDGTITYVEPSWANFWMKDKYYHNNQTYQNSGFVFKPTQSNRYAMGQAESVDNDNDCTFIEIIDRETLKVDDQILNRKRFRITYEVGDGRNSVHNPSYYCKGFENVTIYAPYSNTLKFKGWKSNYYYGIKNSPIIIPSDLEKDVTFTAIWETTSDVYRVTVIDKSSTSYVYAKKGEVFNAPEPKYESYYQTFQGWYIQETQSYLIDGSIYNFDYGITIEARYSYY